MSFIKLIGVYKCRRDCIFNGCKKDVLSFISVQNIIGCQLLIMFKSSF